MARIYLLTIIILSVFGMAIWKPTNAFFTDTTLSGQNVFAAAESFPSGIPTITPSETPTITPTPTDIPTPTSSVTPTPTVVDIANHLVISEVQIAGAAATNDFVEIYNPTNIAVNISGWKLRVKNSVGSETSLAIIPSTTIPTHGYYLWANNMAGFSTSINADTSNGNVLSSNFSIALLTNSDVMIDQLGWGNSTNPFLEGTLFVSNPPANQSIERKASNSSDVTSMMNGGSDEFKGNGYDSNNNTNDFVLRTTSQPQKSSSPAETL